MNQFIRLFLSTILALQSVVLAEGKPASEKKSSPIKASSTASQSDEASMDMEKMDSKKNEALQADPAKNETLFLNSLDYPELQVVPRASERLQMDVYKEQNNGWFMFWPFHIASGTTLMAALLSKNRFNPKYENDESFRRNADFKVNAAAGLSVSWFALTYFISASEPYGTELNKINQIKGKDKKSQLMRERIAEEAMQKPAELIKMLSYLSTLTNIVAAGGLIDVVNEDYNFYAGIAIISSFLPLIFKNKYLENYEKHLEYKRKIYAPVVFTDFYKPNLYGSWTPRLVMQWDF